MAFTDNFNRANASLESSGSWTLDVGDPTGALTIVSNQLANTSTASAGSAYKAPDQGSTRHYVQVTVANVTSGTGPFIACRLTDHNNFLGVRVGDPGIGAGTIEVYRRISGSLTSLYLSPTGTASVNDVIRLECVEGTWALFRNGRYVTGGLVGSVPSTTRTGLVGRATSFSPWIDDFETGAISRTLSDDFTRSDEYLEFSAASSSGQHWRYDYNVANGGGIRSNQLACTTTDGEGSLYFWNTGVQNQYIRFTIRDTTANSFVVLRCNDRLNWVGVRANGSDLQLYQRVSGSFSNFYSANHGITAGDVIEIQTAGVKDLLVYKNGTLVATVTTGPSLTGTNVGIHVRQAIQNPFIDNFTGGEIPTALVGATDLNFTPTGILTGSGKLVGSSDFLFNGSLKAAPGIQFIGSTTGVTSVTSVPHEPGDLLILMNYRSNGNSSSTPAGFTSIVGQGGSIQAGNLSYQWATTSGTTTVSNMVTTHTTMSVYRGAGGIGASAVLIGSTASGITYQPLTLWNTSGSSWVVSAAGHKNSTTALETGPTGSVLRANFINGGETATFDTGGGVASWAGETVVIGGTAAASTTLVAEIYPSIIGNSDVVFSTSSTIKATGKLLGASATTFSTTGNLASIVPPPTIEYISGAVGVNNIVTMPTHDVNDLLVMYVFRTSSLTLPTVPAGWDLLKEGSGSSCVHGVFVKRATSSSEVSGVWTNSENMILHVYRNAGVTGVNTHASTVSEAYTTFTGITCGVKDSKSWVVAFAGVSNSLATITNAPTGLTLKLNRNGSNNRVASFDSTGGTLSIPTSAPTSSQSGTRISVMIELVEQLPSSRIPVSVFSDKGHEIGTNWNTGTPQFQPNVKPAMRFNNVAINKGDTVTKAYLCFSPSAFSGSGTFGTWYGDAVDNSAVLSSTHRPSSGMTATTASSIMDTDGGVYRLEVTSILQEIVNRSGWTNGNSVSFFGVNAGTNNVNLNWTSGNSAWYVIDLIYSAVTTAPISGTASVAFTNTGFLKGLTQLSGTSTLTFSTNSDLRGILYMSASSSLAFTGSGTGFAGYFMVGSADVNFGADGTLSSIGKLAASTDLTFTQSATLAAFKFATGSTSLSFTQVGIIKGSVAAKGATSLDFTTSSLLKGVGLLRGSTSTEFTVSGPGLGALVLVKGETSISFSFNGKGMIFRSPFDNSSNTDPDVLYGSSSDEAPFLYDFSEGALPDPIYEED